jgi:hypothetical protein
MAPDLPRSHRWWIMMYAGALFLPPIPLGFTETARSKLLPGAIVAVAYLIWRPIFCRAGIFHFSTFKRFLPVAIGFYVFGHAMYFALNGNYLVALNELQWLVYLIAPLLMAWDVGPSGANYIVKALLACLGIESVLAVISSFTGPMYEYVVLWYGPRFGTSVYRAVGTMDSTNSLGGLLAFGALVCLFAPAAVLPVRRSLIVIGLLAGVILSQSKSAFFSLLISFVVISVVGSRWRLMSTRELWTMIGSQALALILVSGVFYFYGDAVADNMSQDYAERAALSERVIDKIAEFDPVQTLFGVGFHGVDFVNPSTGAWITAHNSYINLLADLGVCGFLLVVCLFVVMVVIIFRSRQWYLLAGLLGLFLHFVTEAFLYAPLFVMTIGTLYGVTCVYERKARRTVGSTQLHLILAGRESLPVGVRR